MALPVVIAKNQTGTPILLPRLGVTVPASPAQITLTAEANFFEIAAEEVLEQRVGTGDVVINDGTSDLSLAESLAFLNATGNMNGPVGIVTDGSLVKTDGTTGRYTQPTGISVDASNNITGAGTINGFDVSDFGDLPAIQVRRSTNQTITTAWADIPFDTIDVENDTSVLERNDTNTDNIDIGEDGLYLISFQTSVDADAGEETINLRVRVNDTTEIPGSLRQISEDDEINAAGNTFVALLSAGDFITYQIMASGAGNILIPESTYAVLKVRGAKGNKGDTGSGSNIIVEDEGTTVPGGPHSTLDFVGAGVTATNAGSGTATVTIPGNPPNIAQYRNSATQTINTAATTINLNATDFEDSNYTRTGNAINFDVAGIYKVSYTVNFDTTANARRTLTTWAELDGTEIVPSRSNDYSRNSTDDTGACGATFFVQAALNEDLTLEGQSTGTAGTLGTLANQVWVSIELVRAV